MTTPYIDDRISRMEGALPYLATKADVESLRADMIAGDAALQSEIGSLRAELRTEIGSLRADIYRDIYRMEARLIKWWVGSMIAMTVVISSLLTIFRFLGA